MSNNIINNNNNNNNHQNVPNVLLNMRVTANSTQGHRKYMEDCYKIRFQRETDSNIKQNNNNQTQQESDILFSYFAIFDGHGGKEASQYCKEKLYWKIIESDDFWSDNDSNVLNAIRNGFIKCHMEMWNELPDWPKTPSGLPSTSGTTATVLFIKKSKAYVGHVGDSGLVIGYTKQASGQMSSTEIPWYGKKLTRDHKPEDPVELKRIQNCGGSVMSKSGVNRVVWDRPVFNQNSLHLRKTQSGIVNSLNSNLTPYEINYCKNQRNVQTERVPFLAVARSLGDLWSYNVKSDEFIVSPVPDVFSFDLDPRVHKCLILATDGLWNVLKSTESVDIVRQTDKETENLISKSMSVKKGDKSVQPFVNPSQRLVNTAIQRCCEKMIRADNTTCITIMLDQPSEIDLNFTQDIMNKTNFERLLKQNKTFDNYSRRGNDSDEFDDYYDELDDDDEEEEEDEIENDEDSNEKSKFTKTFSGQMLTSSTLSSEFNTPLDSDKRSRSLISLRRRHWSASTSVNNTNKTNNRSSSVNSTKMIRNNFINTEDRNKRVNVYNRNNDQSKYDQRSMGMHLKQKNSNVNNITNNNKQNLHKSNLNVSSISAINRFSKNLRKSFNDLYTSTSNRLNPSQSGKESDESDSAKENVISNNKKNNQAQNQQQQQQQQKDLVQSISNRYTKRLKKFKNRLIKTKNNLLNRKRKMFNESLSNSFSKRKSISSPNLKNLKISQEITTNTNNNNNYNNFLNVTTSTNQSFVNNMRSKFNHLKRNQSSKQFNYEANMHLNSTTISTKFSSSCLKNINSNNNNENIYEHTPSKRAKFY